jgi:hypothetical protein
MATLRFSRPFQLSQGFQSWRLYLDGEYVAKIGNGTSVEVSVPAGRHDLLARTMIMYSSKVVPFEVQSGETLDIEVGSNAAGLMMFVGAVYLFSPSDYLYLRIESRQRCPDQTKATKRGLLIAILLVGLLIMGLGGCGLLFSWIFVAMGDAAQEANQFLTLLGDGKVAEAYNSTAAQLRSQQSQQAFADSVRQLGLTDHASSSWSSRKFNNGLVTLEGFITTKTGATIPITMVLVKESGSWRVLSITPGGGM